MDSPTVARIVNGVDQRELVDAVAHWVAEPSLGGTPGEARIQTSIAADLRADGLEVEQWSDEVAALAREPGFPGMEVPRDAIHGVLARLPGSGSGPSLLLLGHTDVVPTGDLAAWGGDPFRLRREGDRLIGRGACDMKAGLAAARAAVRAVRAAGCVPRGDILIAPVSAEEDGGAGTYSLLRRGIRADMCVIPEPTGLDIVPANAGALTFRLRVHGRATHASRRDQGVSTIDLLPDVLDALRALERRRNARPDPLVSRWPIPYPISLGVVRAGDWASTVPDLLEAEGRLGVALGESPDDARAELTAALAALGTTNPWLRDHPVEIEWWGGQFASGRTDVDHPLVEHLAAAHAEETGRAPGCYGAPYGSDLRLLAAAGIPTVQYGPGDAARAHAPDEDVALDQVMACARVIARLIVAAVGVDPR